MSLFQKITNVKLGVPDILPKETMEFINTRYKIYKEAHKTVFANWSMVDPGETIVIYLKYKLPFVYSFPSRVSSINI